MPYKLISLSVSKDIPSVVFYWYAFVSSELEYAVELVDIWRNILPAFSISVWLFNCQFPILYQSAFWNGEKDLHLLCFVCKYASSSWGQTGHKEINMKCRYWYNKASANWISHTPGHDPFCYAVILCNSWKINNSIAISVV